MREPTQAGRGETLAPGSRDLRVFMTFRTSEQCSSNQETATVAFFNFRGLGDSSSDLTRTKSIANIFSPRSWRGSGADINGNSASSSGGQSSSKPWRLSSLISLTGSLSDLGYTSEASSRRGSLAVSLLMVSNSICAIL